MKDASRLHWHTITADAIARIRQSLSDRLEASTANRYLSALRQVLKCAWRDGSLPYEAYLRLSDVRRVAGEGLPRGRSLQERELGALYGDCRRDPSPSGRRDACILGLLHAAGLRAGEVAALTLEAIANLDAGELLVHGKGRTLQPASMGQAAPLLTAWLDVRGLEPGRLIVQIRSNGKVTDEGLSAQAIYEVVQKRSARSGIKVTAHDLRRTFATTLLRAGFDHLMLQRALRHRDVRSVHCYDRRTDEERAQAQRRAISIPGM